MGLGVHVETSTLGSPIVLSFVHLLGPHSWNPRNINRSVGARWIDLWWLCIVALTLSRNDNVWTLDLGSYKTFHCGPLYNTCAKARQWNPKKGMRWPRASENASPRLQTWGVLINMYEYIYIYMIVVYIIYIYINYIYIQYTQVFLISCAAGG